MKLEANTTGVDGGGIVRVILPRTTPYTMVDRIGYDEPNAYCQPFKASNGGPTPYRSIARWVFVRINDAGLEGWTPVNRVPNPSFSTDACP